jgi:hypothetical protein
MAQVIHTYCEALHSNADKILAKFKQSWEKHGYTVVVHGIEQARSNPLYGDYMRVCEDFPTLNHKNYELCCFRRWMAFDLVGVTALFSDYDILNCGMPQDLVTEYPLSYFGIALASLPPLVIRKFIYTILGFPPWQWTNHVSDMIIFNLHFAKGIPAAGNAGEYALIGEYPDTSKPLIHFHGSKKKDLLEYPI